MFEGVDTDAYSMYSLDKGKLVSHVLDNALHCHKTTSSESENFEAVNHLCIAIVLRCGLFSNCISFLETMINLPFNCHTKQYISLNIFSTCCIFWKKSANASIFSNKLAESKKDLICRFFSQICRFFSQFFSQIDPLSILLTKLLTHIKQGLQKYCETAYSRSGINQMWILKNSKELLEHLKSPTFNHVTSIKSFDFSTLYTTIPHQKLKDRLTSIIRNAFIFKNGNRRYKYLVLGHEESYFVKEHSDSKSKYSEDDIIKMLEFLVDNIFVVFAGKVFQQTVGIPMGTNCAPLLADIFLYSYEADFIQSLLSTGKKHLASRFNLTYRYIDDVLSINNPEFENYLGQMYPAELEIKDTTESTTSASYLDLLLSIGRDGQLHTSIYDKRDDFNFHITNFPFLSSNIPSSPAYGVFISQLIRYARACSSYECFILRARRLSSKLLKQGYLVERLKSSFRKFYGRYGDLIEQYGVTLSRMLNDILTLDQQWLPYRSDFPPISWPLYRAWPSPNYEWFPWSICNGCG